MPPPRNDWTAWARLSMQPIWRVRLATLLPVCAMAVGHDNVGIGIVRTTRTRVELQRMFGPFFDDFACADDVRLEIILSRSRRLHATKAGCDQRRSRGFPNTPSSRKSRRGASRSSAPVLSIRIPTSVPPVHFGGLKLTRTRIHRPLRRGIIVTCDEADTSRTGARFEFDRQSLFQSIAARVSRSRDRLHASGRERSRRQSRANSSKPMA